MDKDQPVVREHLEPVNIAKWVAAAQSDPIRHRERKATEVLLGAMSLSEKMRGLVFLKGGILMAVGYGSPRQTADIDFSTLIDPQVLEELDSVEAELNAALRRSAIECGHIDLVLRVQTIKRRPKRPIGEEASFPALQLSIGYAVRDTPEIKRLEIGQSPHALHIDINFNEPICGVEVYRLGEHESRLYAYSFSDLVAEKMRALLQQPIRNRNRRQDVYDLAFLIERSNLTQADLAHVLEVFRTKCRARSIEPDAAMMSHPEVAERARAEWSTLERELEEMPDFDQRFLIVESFYKALPWNG